MSQMIDDRLKMADRMYEALCRITESQTLADAINLAEAALVLCETVQAREIEAEAAPVRASYTLVDALQTPSPARDEARRQANAHEGEG